MVGILTVQLTLFLWVDTVAALARRRRLASAAGRRMRIALVRLGPAYAKLARLMASHAAVVPGPMLAGFESSPEPTPPRIPAATVRSVVERELGAPIAHRFSRFEDDPLTVTSTAQLHGATLTDGTAVVVKVVRPGLAEHEADQAWALSLVAALARRFLPKGVSFDQAELVRRLTESYHAELDLRIEAQHLERALALPPATPAQGIVAPRPIAGMVTANVLVTERLDGTPLCQISDPARVAALLGVAVDALLWGVAKEGVFHADLSPANLVALADGRLGLVDYGNCCELDEIERAGLARLLDATARHDERAQLHALDRMHAIKDDVDRRALLARLGMARRQKGDLWRRDPLHDVPHLFLLLADSGIEVTVPVLRLAENLLHLEATAAGLGTGIDLGPHLEATCKLRGLPPVDPYGPPLTDTELEGAVAEPERRVPSFRDLTRMIPASMKPSRQNIGTFLPLLVFIPVNMVLGLAWAIGLTTGLTVAFTVYQRMTGKDTSTIGLITVGFIAIPGVIGVVFKSKIAFFGPQMLFPVIIGFLMIGSVLVGRPILAVIGQAVWPQPASVRRDPSLTRTFAVLTLVWGTFHLAEISAEMWLLVHSSANTFVALRTVLQQLNLPVTIAVLWLLKRAIGRAPEIERRILATAVA